MHVTRLALSDFRSYESADVALGPGVTAFVGPNGQGKTNLVEAIGYAATLGSHRVGTDAPLVRLGAARAVVRVAVRRADRLDRPVLVELEISPGRANRARVNRAPVPRPRDVLGLVRTVLFAPEDLALVKGDPAERRRFLDDLLVARAPRMAGVRANYDRVLKQRNALLKSAGGAVRSAARDGGGDLRTLEVWDAHLATSGAELLAARLELVEALRPLVDKAYLAVASGGGGLPGGRDGAAGGGVALDYRSSVGDGAPGEQEPLPVGRAALAEAMLTGLARVRRAELERGVSLVGPHRDELLVKLGELPARGYASQGESWSLALALRLGAYDLLRAEGDEPVLLLDDVFAELDDLRRARLAEVVAPAEQVLVTAAVAADVPEALRGARFDVRAGAVSESGGGA